MREQGGRSGQASTSAAACDRIPVLGLTTEERR
jgi:hypothetical protein